MNYGVPYKGSKSSIAKNIIEQMPAAENFYDVFAGGCAITHAALLSGKYKNVYCNDLDWRGPELFRRAINGEYDEEKRWISREDFFRLKDEDPYVAFCWSFGNDGATYCYGREIEEYKRAVFEVIMADTVKERRLAWRHNAGTIIRTGGEMQEKKKRPGDLESLERLESLQNLKGLPLPEFSRSDYRAIKIKPNSVIYCDIPYKGTGQYAVGDFDHAAFYEWAREQKESIFVSEYEMPDDFKEVWRKQRRGHLSATNNTHYVMEKLFTLDAGCLS